MRLFSISVCLIVLLSTPCFAETLPTGTLRTIVDLGSLGGPNTTAFDVNNSGQVVGFSYLFTSSNFQNAFIWDEIGGMQSLGVLEFDNSFALAINESAQVVGFEMNSFGFGAAFIWDAANGMRRVPGFGGSLAVAADINNLGQVVGHGIDAFGVFKAYIWDEINGLTPLGTLGGAQSTALGINDKGQVVGSSQTADGTFRAYMWDSVNGMQDLGIDGEASDINNFSEVVGIGVMPSGESHAFLYNQRGFSTDFEGTLPAEIALLNMNVEAMDAGVDGSYGDHGFSGTTFVRTKKKSGTSSLTVNLTGLPTHTAIDIDFLLAVIDQTSAADTVEIKVDGVTVFLEGIAWDGSGWNPGAPIEMFSNLKLGYSDKKKGNGYDKGLNFGLVSASDHSSGIDLNLISHTANTAIVEIIVNKSKGGIGFAVDDLSIRLITDSPFVDLGTLGGTFSHPRAINECGTVVGVATDATEAGFAFVWRSGTGMEYLGDLLDPASGWTPTQAWGLNDLDDIVGEEVMGTFRAFFSRP